MKSFEKYAKNYQKFNFIQKEIILNNLSYLKSRVVDLGCGSEGLCKYKRFDFYLGLDISKEMLNLNPCSVKLMDFNRKETFDFIKKLNFNQIVSFSALQWAKDLDFIFKEVESLNKEYLFAIFTSNTFKTLHSFLNINSPIFSKEEILRASSILNPKVEVFSKTLFFTSPVDMIKFITKSGISGERRAKISKLKSFIKEFPFNYLEIEVLILRNF